MLMNKTKFLNSKLWQCNYEKKNFIQKIGNFLLKGTPGYLFSSIKNYNNLKLTLQYSIKLLIIPFQIKIIQ